MAKAQFHRNQKVWVSTVGTWALIEKIIPVWAKGFDEPVRIAYEVGLGREFLATELQAEDSLTDPAIIDQGPGWRVLRAQNKWQPPSDCSHHPFPGSYPIVVTDTAAWGGWRVPGAEYDRDPRKIEFQSNLIASAPALMRIAQGLNDLVADSPEDAPPVLQELARKAASILRALHEIPLAPEPMVD